MGGVGWGGGGVCVCRGRLDVPWMADKLRGGTLGRVRCPSLNLSQKVPEGLERERVTEVLKEDPTQGGQEVPTGSLHRV